MTTISAQRHNGKVHNMSTLTEPEDFDVTLTEEEERKLHNWCATRGLILADMPRAVRGGNRCAITRKSQKG